MKAVVAALAVAVALFVASAAAAPLLRGNDRDAIPDQYIVVFKQISKAAREAHIKRATGFGAAKVNPFVIGNFTGYSALLRNTTLTAVLGMPEVAYVEADHEVKAVQSCVIQQPAPSWGLDRISEIDINLLDGRFPHSSTAGTGVDVYIVDTGIYLAHSDWTGRVEWGFNSADTVNDDCNGHGTHVAGTAAGTLYGVAKFSHLIAVKVLGCGGSGSWAGVISGIQYVAQRHATSGKPSVANLSLGGGYQLSVNQAVTAAVQAGVVMVIAAGNNNGDACQTSPASTPECISVGATDIGTDNNGDSTDVRSFFSNYGSCTDVFAPGSAITSAWITGPDSTNVLSGTSMAAPHIAGVAATILGANPALTPEQVLIQISNTGGKDKIDLQCGTNAICQASPNLMGFIGCAA
jgi:subtilisin family serine protease